MKNLFKATANEIETINGFQNPTVLSRKFNKIHNDFNSNNSGKTGFTRESLLTPEANLQMKNGLIPDLWNVCNELFKSVFFSLAPYSALQFISVMQTINSIEQEQLKRFLKNPDTRIVLMENELLKIVLIHWQPGKVSSIHGHPKGGCVFKILSGKVEELRYTTEPEQKIISSSGYRAGSIAYIDDNLGYHAVGNPFGTSAVSLHAYTPGI